MSCPSHAELLNLWERAYGLPPARRAIEIARTGNPNSTWLEIAQWPIGYRDRSVAQLRTALFGPQVPSMASCPKCHAPVEFEVPLNQCFRLQSSEFETGVVTAPSTHTPAIRPVSTMDVIEHLESSRDEELLIRRCLGLEANAQLPVSDLSQISAQLEEIDPEARILFSLQCPGCGKEWSSLFDIVAVFWTELNA